VLKISSSKVLYTLEGNVILVCGNGMKHPNHHLDGQDIIHPWLLDNGMGPTTMKAIKMVEWNVE
jgi:hypothetical protein